MAEQPKPGSIVHVEFHVKEPKKVEQFYGRLFGWKFEEVPGMNYSLFQAPGGPNGGVGGLQPGNWPAGVTNYIYVDSIESYERKIRDAGGKIIQPKNEVPGQGWFTIFEDPSGTRMALWEPNPASMQQMSQQAPRQQSSQQPRQQPRQQQSQKQQSW